MFFKLPFLTIIFVGIVIFENKIPLSFAKDVSTESTKVDQVEVASTLKIINQVNEADRVQGQINKKRRKSGRRTLIFNPNKRKTSGRSFAAPRAVFDNSKIISGVCHTKSDRMGIALGFVPHKTEKESLQYLDNLIECGLPCFKESGQQQKDIPDSFAPGCCDCCEVETKNDLYPTQTFSTEECGYCVNNFIQKSYDVPDVKKCVAEKNKQTNTTKLSSVLQMGQGYQCFVCGEDDADNTTITFEKSTIIQRSTMILESITDEVIKEMETTPSDKGMGSISPKIDDATGSTEEKNTVTSTMTFEAGVTTSTFEIIKYELKEAFTETLTLLLPEFKFDASEVGLNFKEDQVVLITFRVDDTEGVLKTIKDDSFMEKLKEKMNDYEILQEVVLKSVSADSSASLDAKHKAELQELLEQANLITYLDSFLDKGADDVKQLREADEDELQDILSDVEMTKPYHIKRFKKALENWNQGPTTTNPPPGSCQEKCIADWTAKGTPDCIKRDACQRACNDGTCPEYNR